MSKKRKRPGKNSRSTPQEVDWERIGKFVDFDMSNWSVTKADGTPVPTFRHPVGTDLKKRDASN
jgi:hypothetical protein